ncbi:YIP1 family protein [Clostridium pasteurianum]|uniref:YIP1 family protein n=1 Tax=Clostridium pasteurianum TaxID=1501 RepID=UPI0035307D18
MRKIFDKINNIFEIFIERPTYLLQFIIIGIISMISNLILYKFNNKSNLNIQQSDNYIIKIFQMPITQFIFEIIAILLIIYIVSLIYYIFLKFIFKFKGVYKQVICIYSISYIPVIISEMIKNFYYIFIKHISNIEKINIPINTPSYINIILNSINIFYLIQFVLIYLGLHITFKYSKKKSFFIVILFWIIPLTISLVEKAYIKY